MTRFNLVLAASAALLVASPAQAQPWTGLTPANLSGDDNPSLFVTGLDDIADNYGADIACEWFGEQECFNNEPGFGSTGWVNGSLRRFVHAVELADQVPFFDQSRTWEDVIHNNVAWVEPHPEGDPWMQAWGATGTCHIDVSRKILRDEQIYMRAAAFLHENRHCHLNDLHGGECAAGPGGCDHAFSDEGAYQWTVEFLAQFASFAPATWNTFQRADAIKMANGILSTNFEEHPGFHYVLGGNALSRRWTFTDMDFESVAADPSAKEAITRIDLHVVPTIVGGQFAPGLQGMRVWRATVAPDGTLGAPSATELGDMGLDPNQVATVDAAVSGPNHVLTGMRIGWGELPFTSSGTFGIDFATRVSFIAVASRIDTNGDLVNTQVSVQGGTGSGGTDFQCPAGACPNGDVCVAGSCIQPAAQPDAAVVTAAPGEVLTGFGLSTSASSLSWGPAVGTSRFPPQFLPYRGGGEGEWTRELVSCPASTTAVGVITARSGDEANAAFVGTMALLCQPDAELVAGQATGATLVAVHPTYETDAGVVPAGSQTGFGIFSLIADLSTHDAVMTECPTGQALIGIAGRSGAIIDRIESLACRSVPSTWQSNIPVNLGGFGGAAFDDRCLPTERIDGFVTRREGQRLRGMAPHCRLSP